MNFADAIKSAGTIIVTVLIFVIVAGWMLAVWANLGEPPTYRGNTDVISYDKFARAKDILVLILPLLTTAVGFWLGSQGTAKAEEKAKAAEESAATARVAEAEAKAEVGRRDGQLALLEKQHPESFGRKG